MSAHLRLAAIMLIAGILLTGSVLAERGTAGSATTPQSGAGSDMIVAGAHHTCGLLDGGVWCWGWNNSGQLGDGTNNSSSVPVQVVGMESGVTTIGAGLHHACAVKDGEAWCWGRNNKRQLGNGTTTASNVPVKANGLPAGVVAIDGGVDQTCAVQGGGAWCWGSGSETGVSTGGVSTPTLTSLDSGVTAIATGWGFSCAVAHGSVWCWGRNGSGELGSGSTDSDSHLTPVEVTGPPGVATDVTAGGQFACAVVSEAAWCWGRNVNGRLGSVTETDVNPPTLVTGFDDAVSAIVNGTSHACGLKEGGMWCWGSNQYGQLGNGEVSGYVNNNHPIPVAVEGMGSGVTGMAAGYITSCAIRDGEFYCWGDNEHGKLGDGTVTDSPLPVAVAFGGTPATPTPYPSCDDCPATISIDADPNAPSVQDTVEVATGDTFRIRIAVTELAPDISYVSYQVRLFFDDAHVQVTGLPENWKHPPGETTGGNLATFDGNYDLSCGHHNPADGVGVGSLLMMCVPVPISSSSNAQDLVEIVLQCVSEGTSSLVLDPHPDIGTHVVTQVGWDFLPLEAQLVNATVACGPGSFTPSPTPTPTATNTPTVVPTPIPTATPCAECETLIAIDMNPGAPGVEDSRTVMTGTTFRVRVTIPELATSDAYLGYSVRLLFDDTHLEASGIPDDWAAPPTWLTGGNVAVFGSGLTCGPDPETSVGVGFVRMLCSSIPLTASTHAQDLVEFMFRCKDEGTSTLTLADGPTGTLLVSTDIEEIHPPLAGATITCEDGYLGGPLPLGGGSCHVGAASLDFLAPVLLLGLVFQRRRISGALAALRGAVRRSSSRRGGWI
jgi:alpha-tubulin suppressor-like RCC1 family protein